MEYTADAVNGFNAVVHKEPAVAKVAAPVAYAAPAAPLPFAAPAGYAAPAVAKVAAPLAYAGPAYYHWWISTDFVYIFLIAIVIYSNKPKAIKYRTFSFV